MPKAEGSEKFKKITRFKEAKRSGDFDEIRKGINASKLREI